MGGAGGVLSGGGGQFGPTAARGGPGWQPRGRREVRPSGHGERPRTGGGHPAPPPQPGGAAGAQQGRATPREGGRRQFPPRGATTPTACPMWLVHPPPRLQHPPTGGDTPLPPQPQFPRGRGDTPGCPLGAASPVCSPGQTLPVTGTRGGGGGRCWLRCPRHVPPPAGRWPEPPPASGLSRVTQPGRSWVGIGTRHSLRGGDRKVPPCPLACYPAVPPCSAPPAPPLRPLGSRRLFPHRDFRHAAGTAGATRHPWGPPRGVSRVPSRHPPHTPP